MRAPGRGEVWPLRAGAFDAQGLVTIPYAKLLRQLGRLQPTHLAEVEARVLSWLGIAPPDSEKT